METRLRLCLCLLAALAPLVRADDRPVSGRVLILENERTLEGDIQRHGDQYCVKRPAGETWVPADKAVGLCATHAEAYRFLRARANLHDPDERLRLARWCQRHGLREPALEEAAHAVQLRPNHAESRRLLSQLQRPPAAATEEAPVTRDEADATPPAPVELNTESLSLFVTKVQPILMNACASCHATGRGGAFKLVRAAGTATASQRTVQQNLAAVLAQVNLEQPQTSPLLVKAINVHGDAGQPPLKGRQVAAFHTLDNWVRQTVAKNPHLRGQLTRPTPPPPAAEAKPEVVQPVVRSTGWAVEVKEKPAPSKPADPFDPAAFNRQMHPQPKP